MPETPEIRSIEATVRLLLRHLPLIVLVAVGGAGVAYVVGPSSGAAEAKAEAVVGLNGDVSYTFWGQVRDTFAARAADDGLAAEILAADPDLQTLEARSFESDSTRILIEAIADDADSAINGAAALAAALVDLSNAERVTDLEAERAALVADLDSVENDISVGSEDLGDAAAAEAAARLRADQRLDTYERDVADFRAAEQERDSLRNRLSVLNREAADLAGDIRELDRELATAEGSIQEVSSARSVVVAADSRATVTVLGGLVGAVLASLAVTTLLGHRQQVSRAVLRDRFASIPVVDNSGHDPVAPIGADDWRRLIGGSVGVGVLRTGNVTALPPWLTDPPHDAVVGTPDATALLTDVDEVVLLCSNADRLHEVDAIITSIEAFGCRPVWIVVEEV
jgi:hypothetical protein